MTTPDGDPLIATPGLSPAPPPSDEALERKLARALAPRPAAPSRYPATTVGVTAILTIFGLALIVQSSRWGNTPSYANLLVLMPADIWGAVYLAVAALMGSVLVWRVKWWAVTAHMIALLVLLGWEFAFVIRWLTDDGTTIVNAVSWGTYVILLLRSAQLINTKAAATA